VSCSCCESGGDTGDGPEHGCEIRPLLELTPIAVGGRVSQPALIGELQVFLDDQPASAETWHRLGVALNAEGRYAEAAAALHSALTLSPQSLGVECDFAFALSGIGEFQQAGAMLEEVIHRDPGNGWAYFHLAAARFRQNACAEAAMLWECAAKCLDDPADCLENLAMAYRRLGDGDQERGCWRRLAAIDPGNVAVAHMLSAVGAAPLRARASDEYVVQLFDRFAADFDSVLGVLDYAVPEISETWMRSEFPEPNGSLCILDAGCGTGLCGERLAPWADRLVGVDLSAEMLERARRRGVYDEIVEDELVSFLLARPGAFDVIVAGDVLCYFGDLKPFGEAALAALRPGGRLAFSVEAAGSDEPADVGYLLRGHGRYSHTRAHVRSAFEFAASLAMSETVLRLEASVPVDGLWVEADRGD